MPFPVVRTVFIVGIIAAAALAVSYLTSSDDLADLKLETVEAFRLQDVPQLAGQATPDTPVFKVRFATRQDLLALASGLDAYRLRNQVLVGDAACNPDLKVRTYAAVADMIVDFTSVYDEAGAVEGRSFGTSSQSSGSNGYVYHFYFGVMPSRMSEFVSSGLQEAPMCFAIVGEGRTGKQFSSNIVPLPPRVLGAAAARLVGFMGRNPL
jgi:hypothetical protein